MAGTKQRWKQNPDRWRIRVDIGRDHEGNRRRLTKVIEAPWTKTGERDVVDPALAKLVIDAALLRGEPGALDGITFAELVDRFLAQRSPRVRRGTERFYRNHLAVAVRHIGAVPVDRVRPVTLDNLYEQLAAEKTPEGVRVHSDLKVAKIHRCLKACFYQAVRWQLIVHNPCRGAEAPTFAEPDIVTPDPEVVQVALDRLATTNPDLWVFAAVAAWTGARRQAICGLTRDRVTLADEVGILDLSQAIHEGADGAWTLGPTKTGRQHTIAIGPRLVAVLGAHLERLDKAAADVGVAPGRWVFPLDPTRPDRLPSPDVWTHRWRRARSDISLPGVKLHHLRHYSVAHLFAGGFDAPTVAGRHSHSTPAVTLARYSKFLKPQDIAAALYLEELGRSTD